MPRTGTIEISLPRSRISVGRAEPSRTSVATKERYCSSRNDKTFATRKLSSIVPPSYCQSTRFLAFCAKIPREVGRNPVQGQTWPQNMRRLAHLDDAHSGCQVRMTVTCCRSEEALGT